MFPIEDQIPGVVVPGNDVGRGSVSIDATLPFYATVTASFSSGSAFFEFEHDPEFSIGKILGVWDHTMIVSDNGDSTVLQPNDAWQDQIPEIPKVLVLVTANGLKLLKPEGASLSRALPDVTILYDQFGRLTNSQFDASVLVFVQNPCPSIPEWKCTAANFAMAMSQCQTYVKLHTEDHALVLTFQGPSRCVDVVMDLWNTAITHEILSILGLDKTSHKNKAGASLILKYHDGVCPVPFVALKIQLIVLAVRVLFNKLHDDKGNMIKLKWLARPIWYGKLPDNMSGATILQVLHAVTIIHTGLAKYRLVCKGKRVLDEHLLSTLPHEGTGPVTIHSVLQLHGGGIPTTKQGLKIQAKNDLAGILLAEGYDLKWVGSVLDAVVDKIPNRDLNALAGMQAGPVKLQKLLDTIAQCDIQIPKIKPQLTSSAASGAKKKKQQALPHPDNYLVEPGALLNEDGTEAAQTQEFGCHVTGFYVATHEFAFPWLRAGDRIATDELAMLILGDLPVPTTLPTNKVTLPFQDDRGRDVLIACHLVQFGDKRVVPKELDQHLIASDNTSLMAITLWKHDWEDQWVTICQNPYRFVKSAPGTEDLIVSIWGKSFRRGRQPTSASDSTSVQMHCLLRSDKMQSFLARSGFNLIWLTPKMENGKPHDMWKLIWLEKDCDIQQATVLGARLSDSAGLVQSNGRYAIRVPADNFAQDWSIVYPNMPVPAVKDTSMIFKLQSLPFGTTKDMLEAWSKHVQWELFPLRAAGPRAWIVGSGLRPEQKQYAFNGLPVLIQEISNRPSSKPSPVVAGPKPAFRSEQKLNASQASGSLTNDPWANYTGPRVFPANMTQHAPQASRSATGPTAERLAQQDEKIASLQKAIHDMQENQTEHGHIMGQMQEDMKQRDVEIRQHVDHKMQGLKKDLEGSFLQALQMQSKTFEHSLNEIKSLLIERPKRKTPDEEDANMNQD